jgi:hypothetical protein
MATKTTDPHGIVGKKIQTVNQVAAQSSQIAAYVVGVTGDLAGLRDLQVINSENVFRLNGMSTLVHSSTVNINGAGTSANMFGLENVSTA